MVGESSTSAMRGGGNLLESCDVTHCSTWVANLDIATDRLTVHDVEHCHWRSQFNHCGYALGFGVIANLVHHGLRATHQKLYGGGIQHQQSFYISKRALLHCAALSPCGSDHMRREGLEKCYFAALRGNIGSLSSRASTSER
jgi:hypothetical protein